MENTLTIPLKGQSNYSLKRFGNLKNILTELAFNFGDIL